MHCHKMLFSTILFENPVLMNMRLRMQLRSATVEKMAGILVFLQNASGNPNSN